MADNTFEILIKYGLDSTKAKEAVKELENIRKETQKAGSDVEAYNKRLEQMAKLQEHNRKAGGEMEDTYISLRKSVEDANLAGEQEDEISKKKFASYKDLKSAVKGLKEEFPMLAHAVKLALNPIALAVAAIAGAFAIWHTKVQQLTESLGGIEMANVGEGDVERITKYASAWGEAAKKMAEAATQTKTIKSDLEATIKIIEGNDKVAKAFGLDTGTTAAADKRGASLAAADALSADARARIARSGTPGSEGSEAGVKNAYDEAVKKAVSDKSETQGRIDWLLGLKESGLLGKMLRSPKFATRYGYAGGFFSSPNESIDSALELERGNLATQQGVIDAGGRFALNSASRAVRRGEISAANADLDTARGMSGAAAGFGQDIAAGLAGQGKGFGDSATKNLASSDPLKWIQGVTELAQGVQLFVQSQRELDRANKELRALVNQNNQRP